MLLIAKSAKTLTNMLGELQVAVSDVGLEIRPGKTNILANARGRKQTTATCVEIIGIKIDVLEPSASTKYFGRALAFHDYHDREINNRIAAAWAKFVTYQRELCDRKISHQKLLKLFKSVITPTVLYCSGCWTMTVGRECRDGRGAETTLHQDLGSIISFGRLVSLSLSRKRLVWQIGCLNSAGENGVGQGMLSS